MFTLNPKKYTGNKNEQQPKSPRIPTDVSNNLAWSEHMTADVEARAPTMLLQPQL